MSASAYLSMSDLLEIERSLSERDRAVLQLVSCLKLASGNQVRRACFPGSEAGRHHSQVARRVLLRLSRLELLDRLDRRVGGGQRGSDAFIYRLAPAGQRLLSFWNGAGVQRGRALPEPGIRFIRHRLAVSELCVRLREMARSTDVELVTFEAEPDCWRPYVGASLVATTLKPDAFVRLALGEHELWWFVEVDLGTVGSTTRRLQAEAYRTYWRSGAAGSVMPRVLWLGVDDRVVTQATQALQPEREDGGLFVVAPFDAAVARLLDGGRS